MLLHESPQLHTERTRRLSRPAHTSRRSHAVRIAVAGALAALANRLAPERSEVPVLRTRAAAN